MCYLQVNALSELITGIYLHEFTANNEREILIPQPGCNDSGALNLHHDNDLKVVVSSQRQPIVALYK